MSLLALYYLFLPAFLGNSAPLLVSRLPWVKRHNRPLWPAVLGSNKTYAGLLAGVLAGLLTGALQYALSRWEPLAMVSSTIHTSLSWSLLVGFLLSFGALLGDAVESAIKRRIGVPPGKPLFFWDGIDYMIGALVFLSPLYIPRPSFAIVLLLTAPIISLAANVVAYAIGWKKVWH